MKIEELKNKVWCIIRPNLIGNQIKDIGIMGAGFFISKDRFVTANHVLNQKAFEPDDNYNNNSILLLNLLGDAIILTPKSDISYYKDKDITLIKFEEEHPFIKLENYIQEGQTIFNLGYPSKEINKLITAENGKIILKDCAKEDGRILRLIDDFSSNSNDVNLNNKKVIITDYSSELGFSGGPLLNSNGKAVGVMSMVIPNNNRILSSKAVAVRAIEL